MFLMLVMLLMFMMGNICVMPVTLVMVVVWLVLVVGLCGLLHFEVRSMPCAVVRSAAFWYTGGRL